MSTYDVNMLTSFPDEGEFTTSGVWDKLIARPRRNGLPRLMREQPSPIFILDDTQAITKALLTKVMHNHARQVRAVYPHLHSFSTRRNLTYTDVPKITPEFDSSVYESLSQIYNKYLYEFRINRTPLSKNIVGIMYGINPDDLVVTLDAGVANRYIDIDPVNGTVRTKTHLRGSFDAVNRFYK